MFIDGDFKSGMGDCKYHCSPTCHPGQVGPDWHYGCTHKAWPQNRYGDFVPFVDCGGFVEKCDLKKYPKLLGRYKAGKTNSLHFTEKKLAKIKADLEEIKTLKS